MPTPSGTIFAEIGIDYSPATKAQQQLLKDAKSTALNIEQNFKNLGIKSAAEMDLMRAKINNSFEMIKNSSKATANDIIRAEQAKNAKLMALNTQQFGQQESLLTRLKSNWLAASMAIGMAMIAIYKAWNVAQIAADYEEIQLGLQGLTRQYNMTAESATQMAKEAVQGQLSMVEAGQLAAKAFALGLNPEQVRAFLVEAHNLTDMVGGKIPEAFEAMERAAATGRARGLVQYGINVDLKKSLLDYANAHGIAVTAISAHNAMQIRAEAIMKAVKQVTDQVGESQLTTADKMNILKATVADINLLLGQGTIRVAAGLVGTFQAAASAALVLYAGFSKVGEGWSNLKAMATFGETSRVNKGVAESFREDAAAAMAAAKSLNTNASNNFDAMTSSADNLKTSLKGIKPILEENGTEVSKGVKERQRLEREMYKDLRGYTTAYYEVEKKFIYDAAKKYEDAQIDKVAVAAWTANELEKLQIQTAKSGDDFFAGMKAGWDDWRRSQGTVGLGAFEMTQKAIKGTADELTKFVTTGKADFKSLADSIIKDLIRIQIQKIMTGVFESGSKGSGFSGMLSGAGSWLTQLFGGGAASYSSMGGQMIIPAFEMHRGGVVGETSSPIRQMPASLFVNAPRLHGGNEYPAILQKGETVLPKGKSSAPIINIINNNGSEVSTSSKETPQGLEIDVMIDQAVAKKLGQFGSSSNKMLRSNFNARARLNQR